MEIILGILLLIGNLWALINIISSPRPSTGSKIAWIILIVLIPLIGFIIWFFAGPRSEDARSE